MHNPYREIKSIAKQEELSPDELVHALIATVFTTCCDECVESIHTQAFLKAFQHMVSEMQLCKKLGKTA